MLGLNVAMTHCNTPTSTSLTTTTRRVVITGIGFLTPAGGDFETLWAALTSGRSALRRLTRIDVSQLPITIGGEVDDSLFSENERPALDIDRALLLCRVASSRALRDANLPTDNTAPHHTGLSLGTGAGPTQTAESSYLGFAKQGWRGLRPRTVPKMMFNTISAHLAIDFGLTGPQFTLAAACASANMAMSRAVDQIRLGKVDVMLTGGTEVPICASAFGSWVAMRVLSPATDPQTCCRPFHRQRSGLSVAEGAAMFVFEEREHAIKRGAKIYAEVAGYGESNDASHMTQPNAQQQAQAIRYALHDAGCRPEDIDYINAHGTATDLNDLTETESIKLAFGEHAHRVAISSSKSVFGHALGASGALELLAILGAFQHQVLPPTANLDDPDPRCDLDYVPCVPRKAKVDIAISNSFAFGGANSVIVLKRHHQERTA